nr:hypothetical protein [Nocardioides eburneiflavus]
MTRGSASIARTLSVSRSVMNHVVPGSSKSCVPIGVETSAPCNDT